MKNIEQLIREYLPKSNIMQLATSKDNQPWLCTVHMYSDKDLNLYWISTQARRHSEEIKQNNKVCAYILNHENTADEPWISGMSFEGTAELLDVAENESILRAYQAKLGKPEDLIQDILSGKNPHKLYKLSPKRVVLFDTKNLQGDPRQEWSVV